MFKFFADKTDSAARMVDPGDPLGPKGDKKSDSSGNSLALTILYLRSTKIVLGR